MTSNTEAPEKAIAKAALGVEWEDTESAARRVAEYAADLATRQQAEAVAAAYEAAAWTLEENVPATAAEFGPKSLEVRLLDAQAKAIRALTPSDATAAMEARDARVWNEAIEAGKAAIDEDCKDKCGRPDDDRCVNCLVHVLDALKKPEGDKVDG
ncbi:hypothetical protein PVV74_11555 [Roseovarius sp. SK2]|uniref:hypothetical protein n=1 Tax=Roseovarius TaxID=74030 RepID=UPI00237BE89F|nr:hypothetical protein [Roseovarius sp. SK2]MDD9726092.1 hypothetical protein [Roseovarius sp. SK2]